MRALGRAVDKVFAHVLNNQKELAKNANLIPALEVCACIHASVAFQQEHARSTCTHAAHTMSRWGRGGRGLVATSMIPCLMHAAPNAQYSMRPAWLHIHTSSPSLPPPPHTQEFNKAVQDIKGFIEDVVKEKHWAVRMLSWAKTKAELEGYEEALRKVQESLAFGAQLATFSFLQAADDEQKQVNAKVNGCHHHL